MNISAETAMASLPMLIHPNALLLELITIIIGIVKKNSSSIVYILNRFSKVIMVKRTSGILNLMQKRRCILSSPESTLAYIARAKRGHRAIFLHFSDPERRSLCCPM